MRFICLFFLISLIFNNFSIYGKSKKKIVSDCFVKTNDLVIEKYDYFVMLKERNYGYDDKERVIHIFSTYFQTKIPNLLLVGDKIVQIDSCTMFDDMGGSTEIHNEYIYKKFVPKRSILFAAEKLEDIKGKIHKIFIIRNNEHVVLDVDKM